jgi:hypothetical protein
MPRTNLRLFPLLAAALLLTASCSVKQTLLIKTDGSGSLAMRVEITKLLHEYIISLAEVAGQTEMVKTGKIFNPKDIQKGFESQPGVTVKRVETPKPDILEVDIFYSSIQEVFSKGDAAKSAGAISYGESGGKKTLKLHLDRATYKQLSVVFPLLADPMFAGLGPQANEKISDEEYLEMVRFSLGDEGPGLLKKSFIDLTIKPEGEIVSQTGGTLANGGVLFRIPLLRLLVLDKPLDYSVSFK